LRGGWEAWIGLLLVGGAGKLPIRVGVREVRYPVVPHALREGERALPRVCGRRLIGARRRAASRHDEDAEQGRGRHASDRDPPPAYSSIGAHRINRSFPRCRPEHGARTWNEAGSELEWRYEWSRPAGSVATAPAQRRSVWVPEIPIRVMPARLLALGSWIGVGASARTPCGIVPDLVRARGSN